MRLLIYVARSVCGPEPIPQCAAGCIHVSACCAQALERIDFIDGVRLVAQPSSGLHSAGMKVRLVSVKRPSQRACRNSAQAPVGLCRNATRTLGGGADSYVRTRPIPLVTEAQLSRFAVNTDDAGRQVMQQLIDAGSQTGEWRRGGPGDDTPTVLRDAPRVERIAPQCGVAFTLRKGQVLRVIDPQGEQVADLFAFEEGNLDRWLSSGRSIDYASKTNLSTGDTLYSNDSRPMFTILGDTVGRHDFLLTPCSQEMFEIIYGCKDHHPSCFENLANSLAPFGVKPSRIHTTFNIFMEVTIDPSGAVKVGTPISKAGDWIELRAEMDLLCGLTACSSEGSNNGALKPIDYFVRSPSPRPEVAEVFAGCEPAAGVARRACNGGTTVLWQNSPSELERAKHFRVGGARAAWI